ncbi:MAG: AAA family ATPase, partial [bacterium]|nr:AAA family ATPase [bacterium]
MDQLIQTYQRLLSEIKPAYYRQFYADFKMENQLVGVVGGRGVGKTTFLLQYLRENYAQSDRGLYITADSLFFADHTLLDIADQFVKLYGGELLCIDEIHKYRNWNQELKNIYDSYPKLKVIFSGSSSINLVRGKYDLSRRALTRQMHGFSFREYLELQTGNKYPVLQINDLTKQINVADNKIGSTEKILGYLHKYWQNGYYPTSQSIPTREAFWDTLTGIIDKTIYEDVGAFYNLKTSNLETLKKIVYFFATSLPGSISINKLASSLGKDHTTITEYVQMLRDTGLLRFLLIDRQGHALVRNAEKIYLNNTNLLYAINNTIGKKAHLGSVRELFVISSLENAGYPVAYSAKGDIASQGYKFEIGGTSKGIKQIKDTDNAFLVKDNILYGS